MRDGAAWQLHGADQVTTAGMGMRPLDQRRQQQQQNEVNGRPEQLSAAPAVSAAQVPLRLRQHAEAPHRSDSNNRSGGLTTAHSSRRSKEGRPVHRRERRSGADANVPPASSLRLIASLLLTLLPLVALLAGTPSLALWLLAFAATAASSAWLLGSTRRPPPVHESTRIAAGAGYLVVAGALSP